MKLTTELRVILGPEWSEFADAFEQCGYGVYVDGGSVIIRENDEARVIMAPSMGRWLVWSGKGEADYAKTHAEARAVAIRWLEKEHGCLYWPKGRGGVFLTAAQMATFSQEWQELIRFMARSGWAVRWVGGSLWIKRGIVEIQARAFAGAWNVVVGSWFAREAEDQKAIGHINRWWAITAVEEGQIA